MRRLHRVALVSALLVALACDRAADEAVIVVHGNSDDILYLASIADELGAGTTPIRVDIFDTPQSQPGWDRVLAHVEDVLDSEGIVGVVGYRDSRATLVVGPFYVEAGVPLVAPNATSSLVRELGPRVFQMVPDNLVQGAFIASVLAEAVSSP